MYSLIDAKPSAVRRFAGAALFYFGSETVHIDLLSGKTRFEIVHSPIGVYGWEFVRYAIFEAKNGVSILEGRSLEPDEIVYFEGLLKLSPVNS